VGAVQGKPGELSVVEFRRMPAVKSMALGAGQRETHGAMVEGSCLFVILQVTGRAVCTQPREPGCGSAFVTGFAICRGVRAQQGEPILVRSNCLHPDAPALYGVTSLALRSKLPAVNVGVAVRALRANVCEHELGVA
jgi:hypothetical protein